MATSLQHPGTLIRALSALELARFRFSSELELQAGIAEVLTGAGVSFEREARIGDREMIDFLIAGDIGLEVKISGSPVEIVRQLQAYAYTGRVAYLILATSRRRHGVMPPILNGVPVDVVYLRTAL